MARRSSAITSLVAVLLFVGTMSYLFLFPFSSSTVLASRQIIVPLPRPNQPPIGPGSSPAHHPHALPAARLNNNPLPNRIFNQDHQQQQQQQQQQFRAQLLDPNGNLIVHPGENGIHLPPPSSADRIRKADVVGIAVGANMRAQKAKAEHAAAAMLAVGRPAAGAAGQLGSAGRALDLSGDSNLTPAVMQEMAKAARRAELLVELKQLLPNMDLPPSSGDVLGGDLHGTAANRGVLGAGENRLGLGGGAMVAGMGGRNAPQKLIMGPNAINVEAKAQGWSQRFKQRSVNSPEIKNSVDSVKRRKIKAASAGILSHPLVARFLNHDFTTSSSAVSNHRVLNHDFQDQPDKLGSPSTPVKHTLAMCALVADENRFLPEWILYHRLLGVERFYLYDSAGAAGAAEVDAVARRIEAQRKGAMGSSADEIKGRVAREPALDAFGRITPERVRGLEDLIDQGVVLFHHMRFQEEQMSQSYHDEMLQHCSATYSSTTNWLMTLDVDEFLISTSDDPYDAEYPYLSTPSRPLPKRSPAGGGARAGGGSGAAASSAIWTYPLHNILARNEAVCIPIPTLTYRNLGIRALNAGVLETHTKRNIITHSSQEKMIINPRYQTSIVDFAGVHSCQVNTETSDSIGASEDIRDSQGSLLQSGGVYESGTQLPLEPLVIAHFVQRDLLDCHSKLAHLDDPNSMHGQSKGSIICDEFYLPTPTELVDPKFLSNLQNKYLLQRPARGIVEDRRARDSWTAQATKAILDEWRKTGAMNRVMGAEKIEEVRDKVIMLLG